MRFQSTHSRGVRPVVIFADGSFLLISIHALTWSATDFDYYRYLYLGISIHALTWSATKRAIIKVQGVTISIHALTWSATSNLLSFNEPINYFNPRTHVECDKEGFV